MVEFLQVLTGILVVLGTTPALAHALELPGKMRMTKEAYVATQPIYYPGFTVVGGFGEVAGMISTLILLLFTPRGTAEFWLTFMALLGLVTMHAVYWLFTHPVNRFWIQGQELGGAGTRFFAFGSNRSAAHSTDWTVLRNRWEYSHLARAILALLSLVALLIVIA